MSILGGTIILSLRGCTCTAFYGELHSQGGGVLYIILGGTITLSLEVVHI